jgi:SAM-dependent methyltransferase
VSELSVIAPVYGNAATLEELHRRVRSAAAGWDLQLILVDDASPDDSRSVISELAARDPAVEPVFLDRNVGQHEAVLAGMRRARGRWTAVLDADLQDPPEAIPVLLEHVRNGEQVVFAGRRGAYQGAGRLASSLAFKRLLAALTGVPRDAGMFFVADRRAVDSLLALEGPPPFLVAMVGAAGLRAVSVPVERGRSDHSSYSSSQRLRSGLRGLRWASRSVRIESHNATQNAYYARGKQRMAPRLSPYIERHIGELCRFAHLEPGQRVLEVGPGQGRYTLPLADRGLDLEVLELVPNMLELLAESKGDREIALHLGDVVAPPDSVKPGFDAVVGLFALHHMHDVPACLASMARLLRPGGRLALLEPNAYNPLYYLQIALSRDMSWAGDRGVLEMRAASLRRALSAAGLEDVRIEHFGFFPPAISNRPRGPVVERALERIGPLRPFLPFQLLGGRAPAGGSAPVPS